MSADHITPSAYRMAVRSFGSGPAIVLLHGIPGSAANWNEVSRELARDHLVVVPDLIGFGASPRPERALWAHDQASALRETLRERGIDRATIVGHDFGGPVALALWESDPQLFSGLVLSATNAFPDTPIPFPLSTVVWPLVGSLCARAIFSSNSLRLMLRQGVAAPGVELNAADYIGDRSQATTIREIFHGSLVNLEARYGPFEKTLGTIRAPTRVVWGAEDMFFSVAHGRRTADAIPGAEFLVYERTGHFIPEEQPQRFARDIAAVAVTASARS